MTTDSNDWAGPFQDASALHLRSIEVRNFRPFSNCSVHFHPKLTVLVSENGQGKSALLDATAIALGAFLQRLAAPQRSRGLVASDMRRTLEGNDGLIVLRSPTEIVALGSFREQTLRWTRTLRASLSGMRQSTGGTATLRGAAKYLRESITCRTGQSPEQSVLPALTFFGTARFTVATGTQEKRRPQYDPLALERLNGYFDGLSAASTTREFVTQYRRRILALKTSASLSYGPGDRPERQIHAVREAIRVVLEPVGWRHVDWDQNAGTLVVGCDNQSRLPLSMLSDGVRGMVSLVGKLALRCVELNPQLGEAAARLTPGLLLIDEVDMHLHPRWQQLVVELLQKAFPAMQMILTTHSPHVLSTVDVKSIRVIRLRDGEGTLETPSFQTRGVESADVLATIMGVDPVPQVEEARWLSRYRAFIEEGNAESPEAVALRTKLVNHFGIKHPLMLDCERLIRFQALKRRTARS